MTDPRQLGLPFPDDSKPKKKRLGQLSPQQERALERIASFSSELISGIDEVGMGSWAGPMYVAAVVLPKAWDHDEVADSKRLTHNQRVRALEHVMAEAKGHCVLKAEPADIDKHGIVKVRERLTEGCALYCRRRYPTALIVQDGDVPVEVDGGVMRVVWCPKADVIVPAVSAASILAKVMRDLFMKKMAEVYPGYGFETNVGYHSKKHCWGLEHLGPTPIHRLSYKPVRAYAQAQGSSSW
jgi:ribonuclease HII